MSFNSRVIARLTKEVTAAREALATLKPQAGITQQPAAAPAASAPQVTTAAMSEPTGMTQDIVEKLVEKAKVLTGERRKKSKMVPEDLITPENIRNFRTIASHPGNHSLTNSVRVRGMVAQLVERSSKGPRFVQLF